MAKNYIKVHHLRRVYVWELPVRIYHWINALAILVLIATGFFIGDPLVIASNKEAAHRYLMGTIRFLHFIAAYVFFANFLFRLYWGFVGNKFASWDQFIPTTKKAWSEIWHVIKIDILQLKGTETISVGHNALAGMIYFMTFIMFLVQCLTGFALYASMSDWWFPKLFSWAIPLFGGDVVVRQIHHWAMWFFILFTVIHVYLVFYHDYVEGRGEISSIGGGWKFIEDEIFDENKTSHSRESTK